MLLDTELQSLIKDRRMGEKIRLKLQDRLVNRVINNSQIELMNFMNAIIDDSGSEDSGRAPAI